MHQQTQIDALKSAARATPKRVPGAHPSARTYEQDTAAGGALADALDEAGEPHAPFFRALSHRGDDRPGCVHHSERGMHVGSGPTRVIGTHLQPGWSLQHGLETSGGTPAALVQHGVYHSGGLAGPLLHPALHTAVMDRAALEEWARHPKLSPTLRAAIINAAQSLPEEPTKNARPIGWLKDKVASWFARPPAPRNPKDGIVHAHATDPTAVYAERNAVAQALRLLGAKDHMAKVPLYTAAAAQMVKDKPDHAIVKAYVDKAKTLGGTAGPELTEAVKPLLGAMNLLLHAHGKDERFVKPTNEAPVSPAKYEPEVSSAEAPDVSEPPIDLADVEDASAPPSKNLHVTVRELLNAHKGDLNKTKAALKTTHALTHQEAHEAVQKFLAMHTGMKGLKAFKRQVKRDPDAKLAKPRPGEAVKPKHLENAAYGRTPINEALHGTALAFHLRQIGQDHPHLAELTDRALARQSVAGSAGADPYAAIGKALKQDGDLRADMFNWHTMHDSLIQDAKVKAFVKQHVTQGYGLEGEHPHTADRRYWDAVHRGIGKGKAKNAQAFWDRARKANLGLTPEQIAESIARLKDRALDREYNHLHGDAKADGRTEWSSVMGAAPGETHAKFSREDWK